MSKTTGREAVPSRLPLGWVSLVVPGLALALGAGVLILSYHWDARSVRPFSQRAGLLREAVHESFLALRALDASLAETVQGEEAAAPVFAPAGGGRGPAEHVREASLRIQALGATLPPVDALSVGHDEGVLRSKVTALRGLADEMASLVQDQFPFGGQTMGRDQGLALERLLKTSINLAVEAEAALRLGLEQELGGPTPRRLWLLGSFLSMGVLCWLALALAARSGNRTLARARERLRDLAAAQERSEAAEDLGLSGSFGQESPGGAMPWSPRLYRMLGYAPGEVAPSLERLVESLPVSMREDAVRLLTAPGQDTEPARVTGAAGPDGPLLQLAARRSGGRLFGLLRETGEDGPARGPEARLFQAVEQARDTVMLMDAQGLVRYISPAWRLVSGRDPREFLGRDIRSLAVERFGEAYARQIMAVLSRGETWTGRLGGRGEGGTPYTVEAAVTPFQSPDGPGYVAVLRDVTQEAGQEKRQRQAQKMEALGTLAGGIAHDFNNILGAIIGYTELSVDDLPEGSPTRRNLKRVLEAGKRADDLVKQILAFSRQSELELRPVRMDLLVKEALKLLTASLPKTLEIRTDIERKPFKVFADPTQIHQIIMNLCANSAYAMRETVGLLEVWLAEVDLTGEQAAGLKDVEPGAYVLLRVRDSGQGIDPAIMDRIFDPFFTTKKRDEGTGMGLAVVHGIVKHLGGDVVVESDLGSGTTVSVYLPRIDAAEEAHPLPEPGPDRGRGRVLFVDDEEPLADAGRQILSRLGYSVATAADGPEALALFEPDPGAFDLVITDQTMPRMTGVELAHRLRALRPGLPVILCTGFSQTMTPERAAEMGLGFLVKPVNTSALAAVVKQALDRGRGGPGQG